VALVSENFGQQLTDADFVIYNQDVCHGFLALDTVSGDP